MFTGVMQATHQVTGGNFGCGCEEGRASVGVRELGKDLDTVVHGQHERLVALAFYALEDFDACKQHNRN